MSSPRPPRGKKGRDAAVSRGWMRFRRERRAGADFFGQPEVVHCKHGGTAAAPLLHFLAAWRESSGAWRESGGACGALCQKREAERLDCDISPAMFRLPQEPQAVPLVPMRKCSTGERKQATPSGETGLDPNAAAQIRHLKQQLQELHTQVAGAFALLLFSSCSRSLPVIAAALACECPQTRRKKLRETGLGIGYGESSTGHKQRRADAKAMEEQIDEQLFLFPSPSAGNQQAWSSKGPGGGSRT